jgi:hypothetical protein
MDGREFVLAEVTTCVDRGRKTNGPILRDPQIGGVKNPGAVNYDVDWATCRIAAILIGDLRFQFIRGCRRTENKKKSSRW